MLDDKNSTTFCSVKLTFLKVFARSYREWNEMLNLASAEIFPASTAVVAACVEIGNSLLPLGGHIHK